MRTIDPRKIRTLVTVDCGDERHKIVLSENGRLALLDHPREEPLFELGRQLASLPPEHTCAAVLRGVRTLRRDGDAPPELEALVAEARRRRDDRARRAKSGDPLRKPLDERLRTRVHPRLDEAWRVWRHEYSAWAQAKRPNEYVVINGLLIEGSSKVRVEIYKVPKFGGVERRATVDLYWDLGAWGAIRADIVLLRHVNPYPGGTGRSPVFVYAARRVRDDEWEAMAIRSSRIGVNPQAWACTISEDPDGEYRSRSGNRYGIRWIRRLKTEV